MSVLKRNDLYADVWRYTMGPLSRKLGISSATIRDACKLMAIPLPPHAHWKALKSGTATVPALDPHDGISHFNAVTPKKYDLVKWIQEAPAEELKIRPSQTVKVMPRTDIARAGAAMPPQTLPSSKVRPRFVPLRVWAEMQFGDHAPHNNTLLKWVHEGRIQPQPQKIGRMYWVKPAAEYVAD